MYFVMNTLKVMFKMKPVNTLYRAGITARYNQFCNILAPRFDNEPSLEVSSNSQYIK